MGTAHWAWRLAALTAASLLLHGAAVSAASFGPPDTAGAGPLQGGAGSAAALLRPGERVRVFSFDQGELEGVFLAADEASLRVRDGDAVVTVKRDAVRRIEVADARGAAKRTAIGSLIGAAVGLGVGAGTAYVLAGGVSGDPDYNAAPALLTGCATGAALGAIIAHATRGPGWKELPPDRVRLGVSLERRHGIRAALTIAF